MRLHFHRAATNLPPMTQPLALLVYEAILPGTQLVNRLRELGYRVLVLPSAEALAETARQEKPLVAVIDLVSKQHNVPKQIADLRKHEETAHLPVIAYCPMKEKALQDSARKAGVTLLAITTGIFDQLPALLEQALEVE